MYLKLQYDLFNQNSTSAFARHYFLCSSNKQRTFFYCSIALTINHVQINKDRSFSVDIGNNNGTLLKFQYSNTSRKNIDGRFRWLYFARFCVGLSIKLFMEFYTDYITLQNIQCFPR